MATQIINKTKVCVYMLECECECEYVSVCFEHVVTVAIRQTDLRADRHIKNTRK